MKARNAYLSDEAFTALSELFKSLGWIGQRGATFAPGLEKLGTLAITASDEIAKALAEISATKEEE